MLSIIRFTGIAALALARCIGAVSHLFGYVARYSPERS